MIVIYCQHRDALTRAEKRMVAGMRDLPGILLVNALVTTGRRTREIDGIWVHPQGVAAIEAKGTTQSGPVTTTPNGPWRVGDDPADFASGPNPLTQARSAAQTLRRVLAEHDTDPGFIPAVVAVSGTDVSLHPHNAGDMPILLVEDLPGLPAHLPAGAAGIEDVTSVLDALGIDPHDHPDTDELAGEGFSPGSRFRKPRPPRERHRESETATGATPGPRPAQHASPTDDAGSGKGKLSSKDRRRARRFADLEAEAHGTWRRLHRRRLVASALALIVLLGYLPQLPVYCLLNGIVFGSIAAAYQLAVRRRLSGPRDHGKGAFLGWLLTLVPVVGIAASLSWMAAAPALAPVEWPFVLMLAILFAAGVGCAILTGKSAFIHPPAIVLERYDEQGRPTGAFMLAEANPVHAPSRDWRPANTDLRSN